MTSLQSFLAPLDRRGIVQQEGPKLRDSCNACAVSKIKCSKEKPGCARCVKRGMVCQYFETKRTRRKQGTRSNNRCYQIPAASLMTASTTSDPDMLASPVGMRLSPSPPPMGYSDIFSGVSSSTDPTTGTPGSNCHFDDFLASPISFSLLDMPATNDVNAPCPSSLQENDRNTPDPSRTHLPASNGPSSIEIPTVPDLRPPNSNSVLDQEPPDSQSSVMNELNCSCLANALRLLKKLPSPASTTSSAVQGFEKTQGLGQPPTLQSVIATNEKIVQAIGDVLQCQCSQDGHLLAILSIIIFKVLGCYAAMVRQTPGVDGYGQCWEDSSHLAQQQLGQAQRTSFMMVDDYCVDGEDKGRIAAQQILSQLHRVQRLVNIFSQRFKIHRGHTEASSSNTSSSSFSSGPDGAASSVESLFYVPGSLLEQIEGDLRKRLRNLSAEIVDTIR